MAMKYWKYSWNLSAVFCAIWVKSDFSENLSEIFRINDYKPKFKFQKFPSSSLITSFWILKNYFFYVRARVFCAPSEFPKFTKNKKIIAKNDLEKLKSRWRFGFKVPVHFRILKKSIFFCIFQLLRPLKIFS